jgi:RNA polymerase sigma factor (sigma-70 family)
MAEIPQTPRNGADRRRSDGVMTASGLEDWFVREVLPLEAALMQFLQHNWHNKSEVADLRQDVYERVCEAAQLQIPEQTKAFVFRTARNLLIDRVRREQVVPIDAAADIDALNIAIEAPGPERNAIARDELRRLQAALDRLPPRCREAIILGHVEGLSGKEIAGRMGVTKFTVSEHLANGVRALTDMLYGEEQEKKS